jgi:Fe-S-cluster containining protein
MAEDEWITGRVTLRIGNVPLDLEMTVPAKPIKPHRMLPIFHKMSEAFLAIGVQAAEQAGDKVSCKPRCTACCHQAVPVSEAEAYYIAALVDALPEPRRTEVRGRFAASLEHFRAAGWFDELRSGKGRSWEGAEELVLDYFRERVPCPFLEDSMCSIYQQRPIACREYIAISDPENCANPTAEAVKLVQLPIKPSAILKKIVIGEASKNEGLFLLLIMCLEIGERYPEAFPEKTGEEWMADFFGRLASEEKPYLSEAGHVPNPKKRRSRHGSKR